MVKAVAEKWVYEAIVDRLLPFSLLSRQFKVLVQLALMEAIGILIAIFAKLHFKSIILGSLAILATAIWSQIAIYMGPAIRSLRRPPSPLEHKVIEEYKQDLFNKKRYELSIGFAIFILIMVYLIFSPSKLLSKMLDQKLNFGIAFFIGILLWDLTYRIGLSLWLSLASLKCSIKLFFASKARFKFKYTPYKELNALKHLSIMNLAFLIGFSPLFPICIESSFLIHFAIAYITLILFFSLSSLAFLSKIPIYPPEVLKLLKEAMYAYIGTSNKKGVPHVTPVIFVFDGKAPYIVTSKISKKIANLKENNKVALLIDVRSPVNLLSNKAVLIKGKAKIFNLFDAIFQFLKMIRVRQLFQQKYPNYVRRYAEEQDKLPLAWRTTIFISRLLIRIDMEEFVYWRRARQIYIPI
jgi:nitroimidazol reductase NimA-like FMN-containing flavoprotein (pyridoxamine 5'-phosphate oxidase superfamily)